ncbi:MAG: CDP-diacylglycerol--serine O-phosphatidyltransferase [Bacteroidales bacterium]|nr:CDP-diacylglycerol--serine O-phosphatidyltransferase [Bacteroidales bacterium]
MAIKKHIPNCITLLNLFCGTAAILLAVNGMLERSAFMIFLAAVFDFFDGLAARALHVKSDIGKELDSLSDIVSFGVAPAFIMYQMLSVSSDYTTQIWDIRIVPFVVSAVYPCCAALRLAKFNLDTTQTEMFHGLPVPAAAFVILSLQFYNVGAYAASIYTAIVILLCFAMLSQFPLLSLKFKNLTIKENIFRYALIGISLILIICLQIRAILFIMMTYFILSIIYNIIYHKKK